MKKNITIIVLALILGGLFLYNNQIYKNKNEISVKDNINEEIEDFLDIYREININVYNKDTDNVEERTIIVKKDGDLDIIDYINQVLDNTDFITKSMKVLATYNIVENGKNSLIVKVNKRFNDLNKETELIGFSKSLSQTILENFSDISLVYLQIDTN